MDRGKEKFIYAKHRPQLLYEQNISKQQNIYMLRPQNVMDEYIKWYRAMYNILSRYDMFLRYFIHYTLKQQVRTPDKFFFFFMKLNITMN